MEDVIVKMAELEAEINADIDKLVTLKSDINSAIKGLSKPNYSMILELRYLSFKNWDEIAATMCYDNSYIFRIHRLALDEVVVPGETGS
jgi:uncharacterized Zn finger protein